MYAPPGDRPPDMLDVDPSTREVIEPMRAPQTTEVDQSRRSTLIDDVSSTITSDGLIIFRKKFHLPNDLVMVAPKESDRARYPPSGFITMYEMTLRAGLRFSLASELLEIFKACGVPLAQFLCRTVTIIVGLTAFYRERGAKLTVDHLSKMCRLTSDSQGHILCRGKKWLDFSTRDPSKNWSSSFFFVKNDWALSEKWGRLKELPNFPHLGEEEILKTLNFSDTKSLQEELRHISQYVMEEKLFKVGLSIQAGRSHAVRLKKSKKVHETSPNAPRSSSSHPSKGQGENGSSLIKKRRVDDVVGLPSGGEARREVIRPLMINIAAHNSDREIRPLKIPIPEDVLRHVCIGRQRAKEVTIQRMDVESQFDSILDDWNTEFVKGEYKRKLDIKIKEMLTLENQLAECRTELAMISTTLSLQNREANRSRTE
ncbi:hypothetical protein IEQ34_014419 [Dendrobium chrysotoxum]|uniref:Uncharacterized protein n=1 Tax=Dendrobium chrysotoxum TaxID=161865 RepID=A0AAV7GLY1_DENCH|nr:hypothetical protein IEQ34_014419 [Dendrobium chrysotoxum]